MLVDTTVWSLAFRRRTGDLAGRDRAIFDEWAWLVRSGQAELIGPIRQELLSGLRREPDFDRVRRELGKFLDIPLTREDFEEAARCTNRCIARGVAVSSVDALICAAALRRGIPIYTLDEDFKRYAGVLPIRLHRTPAG